MVRCLPFHSQVAVKCCDRFYSILLLDGVSSISLHYITQSFVLPLYGTFKHHTYFTHKDYPIMHENPYMITQSIVHITQTRLDNHSKTSRPQPFILPLLECKAIYITDYYPTIRLQLRNHMYYLFKNTQP
jgi:hypothetical protein